MSQSRQSKKNQIKATRITKGLLRSWSLPYPDQGGDKEERGRALIIAGHQTMPGAAILASTAALRAGAGKLQIATTASIAPYVAMSVPEALVLSLPDAGLDLKEKGLRVLESRLSQANAVLIGPGFAFGKGVSEFVAAVVRELNKKQTDQAVLILDAEPLKKFSELDLSKLAGQTIITPHAGEMAELLAIKKDDVLKEPLDIARQCARERNVITVLKGRLTYIASPEGDAYVNDAGNVGLAASGSGDTLAGIIAGLAARGASALQAAVWGVHLHACAGDKLARSGELGYLTRDLAAEIPKLMAGFR